MRDAGSSLVPRFQESGHEVRRMGPGIESGSAQTKGGAGGVAYAENGLQQVA